MGSACHNDKLSDPRVIVFVISKLLSTIDSCKMVRDYFKVRSLIPKLHDLWGMRPYLMDKMLHTTSAHGNIIALLQIKST